MSDVPGAGAATGKVPGGEVSLDDLPLRGPKGAVREREHPAVLLFDVVGEIGEQVAEFADRRGVPELVQPGVQVGVLAGELVDELHELAQKHGWHIGPTNDEDGVAEAIEAALR